MWIRNLSIVNLNAEFKLRITPYEITSSLRLNQKQIPIEICFFLLVHIFAYLTISFLFLSFLIPVPIANPITEIIAPNIIISH